MRWVMKRSKTDTSGEKAFDKIFLVDPDRNSTSARLGVTTVLHTSIIKGGRPVTELRVFLDRKTVNEIMLAASGTI